MKTLAIVALLGLPTCLLAEENDRKERPEPELSTTKWTNLVALRSRQRRDAPLPDNFPVWNVEKGYSFAGAASDPHRLAKYEGDGEFIIRKGYLRRELGNSALLRLPSAENFDIEGIMQCEGVGGWLILLGWDFEQKSGYIVYNTKLRVSGSHWFLIEIDEGQPIISSERKLAERDAKGEGALRLRMDDQKLSLQVSDALLIREEKLPNYKAGHVAIGTFSPPYGPQDIGIKSLRMKLR
jgi:hypothetical protein